MNWFNGKLEVTYIDGSVEVIHDISLSKAVESVERIRIHRDVRWAIYTPSAISLL